MDFRSLRSTCRKTIYCFRVKTDEGNATNELNHYNE